MKSPYVSELQPNQIITATFLVQHKDIRQKKTGEPYLSLILGDRTGEVDAKMWDNVAEVMDTFERDDFLRVRGLLQVYQNRLQLTVHKLQRQADADIDVTDYFPASERKPDEMLAELHSVIASIQNPHMRALLKATFEDDAIAERFKIAPAAKNIHHAYLGGLIEHVLSLCGLARMTAAHYKNVDVDLLLTGAILHDVGKIYELTYDRSFSYSTQGQLLGHIIIGLRMLDEKVRLVPGFPPRLKSLIEHMIISHHGELEYGSPKVPVFLEALLLHHLDNLDSKMESMRSFADKDRHVEGCWTGFSATLERSVLKKVRYLEQGDEPVPAPVPPVSVPAPAAAMATSVAAGPPPAPPAPPVTPAPPVAAKPAPPPVPPSQTFRAPSVFAEKLQGALKGRE